MTYEATLYEQARQVFLNDVARMNLRNDEYAEKRGGVEAMDLQSKSAYNLNRDRLIRLVQYHDATQQYIEQLHSWIEDLTYKNRDLANRQYGWQAMFPILKDESAKEHKRHMTITHLQLTHPELF